MNNASWLDGPAIRPLADELVATVVAQYRIEAPAAERLLRESMAGDRALAAAAASAQSPEGLRRMRVFKDAAAEAKRKVYHALRQYHCEEGDNQEELLLQLGTKGPSLSPADREGLVRRIARLHASTRERLPDEGPFYDAVLAAMADAETLLDVGCGVQPLRFPLARLEGLRLYAAIDSNRRDIEAVIHYAHASNMRPLIAWEHDLADGWDAVREHLPSQEFDVALLFKLAPVIARQERRLLSVLAKTPARRWIVTGSKTSLAKRASIERRERAVIEKFLASAGRTIRSEFSIGEEFGYVVE